MFLIEIELCYFLSSLFSLFFFDYYSYMHMYMCAVCGYTTI